jgi:3-deoxy-D-manno-octulosonic-acid transferase
VSGLFLKAYGLAMGALEPLAPTILRMRARAGKEDPERVSERLGRASMPRPPGDVVWLHGASVGETLSLLPLVEALQGERPDLTLLVTSGTVTSAHILGRRLPRGVIHQYLPLDTPTSARRFLTHWRPILAVLVESELWPGLLLAAKAGGTRLALLGARLSEGSVKGWARAPRSAKALLGAFDLILAQDPLSRQRIESLGGRVAGELDLKKASAPLACDEDELARLKTAIGERAVLVAASTHPGEDEIVADVLAAIPAPKPLLILVPRHPERGAPIAASLAARGLTVARRGLAEPVTAEVQAYIADTLGELGLIYRLADVAIMGGSLVGGVGGHNPREPARLGVPVVAGPDTGNFREAYAGLQSAQAAIMAEDLPALSDLAVQLIADPVRRGEMGRRAKAYAEHDDQALEAALKALRPMLPPAGP